jgi:hypothetical protein
MKLVVLIDLGTGHKLITRGGWRINEISSTYFHTLPKTYGKIFVTPFNVGVTDVVFELNITLKPNICHVETSLLS